MKKKILYSSILLGVFMASCQREPQVEDTNTTAIVQRSSWHTANLDAKFTASQKQVTAYLFSAKVLSGLISTPYLDHVRFVLGYDINTIQIKAVGVDNSDNELKSVDPKLFIINSFTGKLAKLNDLKLNSTYKRNSVVTKHVLSPKVAFASIQAWRGSLLKMNNLDYITSYGGERIQYFSIETVVVEAMIQNSNIANVALFLGLNSEGKMTTIFIGLDKNNEICTVSHNINMADCVYDFTTPCPPMCGNR